MKSDGIGINDSNIGVFDDLGVYHKARSGSRQWPFEQKYININSN